LFNAAVVPNGQTVTDYWVTSDPRVGQWYYNGQAITGEIAAFELPSLTFQGVGPGTDTVYLQASDDGGNTWSAWQGNGVTVTASGLYATPGSVLQDYQPLAGAAASATVGIGSTLILWASDSASVTFQGSTGLLELEQPTSFTGEINNFSGNGTLAGSDQIDLNGFSFTSIQDSYSNGVLTLGNGAQSATLDFSGSYVLANFDFANDGHGGTLVYDPPVTSNLNSSKSSTPEGSAWDVSGPSSLGYSSNGAQSPVPMAGGHQNTTLALLANYMASSFPTAASNDAGPMSEAAPNLASTQWQLATNHHA